MWAMTAGIYDIVIEQGATFQQDIYWQSSTQPPEPINLAGYTAQMEVRSQIGAPDPPLLDLTTTSAGPGPTYSSGIILGTTNGLITIYITAADTLALTWVKGVYDLDLISSSGFVTRLLQGAVTVNQTVTTTI